MKEVLSVVAAQHSVQWTGGDCPAPQPAGQVCNPAWEDPLRGSDANRQPAEIGYKMENPSR